MTRVLNQLAFLLLQGLKDFVYVYLQENGLRLVASPIKTYKFKVLNRKRVYTERFVYSYAEYN